MLRLLWRLRTEQNSRDRTRAEILELDAAANRLADPGVRSEGRPQAFRESIADLGRCVPFPSTFQG